MSAPFTKPEADSTEPTSFDERAARQEGAFEPAEPRPTWWAEDADGSLRRALMDCYNG